MAILIHDTRDKPEKHRNLDEYLAAHGHKIVRSKMFVGDIALLNDQTVCIDLKRNMAEVVTNLCQQHERFRRELERANEAGIKLIFLVEHGGAIKTLEDVKDWVNPRIKLHPLAMSGQRAYKVMLTIANRYGVEWHFCDKRSTGRKVCDLLGVKEDV